MKRALAPPAHARGTVALVLFALALRLAVALWLHPRAVWDGELYERAAALLAEGRGYTYAMYQAAPSATDAVRPTAYYPVGYPAFLALAYALFGRSLPVLYAAGALVSALTVGFTHRIALRVGTPRAALLAALALALMPGQVLFAASAMTEPLFGLLLAAAVYALVRSAGAPRRIDLAAFGALLGLATLVRPQALLLAPVLPLLVGTHATERAGRVVLRRRIGSAALATLACLLCVAPWSVRNCRVLDRCALVSTNGGSNLAIGAVPRATGGYFALDARDGCYGVDGEVARDRCWRGVARAAIVADPARWARLAVEKLDQTLAYEAFPVGYLVEAGRLDRAPARVRTVRRAFTAAWRLLLLVVVASLVARGPSRRGRVLRPLDDVSRVLLAACAVQLATHLLFFGGDRYHLPWVPLLCALAAGLRPREAPSPR